MVDHPSPAPGASPRLATVIRRELARRPWLYWAAIGLAVAMLLGIVIEWERRERAERTQWGRTATVLVAREPMVPGDPIDLVVDQRLYPVAMIPEGAIASLPPDARAARQVEAGRILTPADLASDDHLWMTDTADRVIVAIVERVPLGAARGDRVAVVSDGIVLAEEAIVVDPGGPVDGAPTGDPTPIRIAVMHNRAATVAAAASGSAGVSLVLLP